MPSFFCHHHLFFYGFVFNRKGFIMIFIDMDGVIAEHIKDDYIGENPKFLQPHYFSTCKPISKMVAFVLFLQEFQIPYLFLSRVSPPLNYREATMDKCKWLCEFVPGSNVIFTQDSKVKTAQHWLGRNLQANDILIDDFNPNLEEWENAGATAIKFLNGNNSPDTWHRTASNITELIEYCNHYSSHIN